MLSDTLSDNGMALCSELPKGSELCQQCYIKVRTSMKDENKLTVLPGRTLLI